MEITEIRRNPLPPSFHPYGGIRWLKMNLPATSNIHAPAPVLPWVLTAGLPCTPIYILMYLHSSCTLVVCTLYDTYARVSNGNLNGGRTDEGDVVKQCAKWWEKMGAIKFFQKFNCFAILSNYARNAYYLGTFPNFFFCRNPNKYAYYLWFF